uniref:Transposase n=1 Tax=Parastrongyloides trichosuri TaxID=131310 RepID=A0A0N4ZK25_PARTI
MAQKKFNESFLDSEFILSEAADASEETAHEIAELYLPPEIMKSAGEKTVEQVKLIKKRDSSGRVFCQYQVKYKITN